MYLDYKKAPVETRTLLEKLCGRLTCHGYNFELVGSRTIEGAATKTSDWDVIIYDNQPNNTVVGNFISQNGFEYGGSLDKVARLNFFESYKSRGVNILLVDSGTEYAKFNAAHSVAKGLGITDKTDRVKVFKFLKEEPDAPTPEEYQEIINKYSGEKGQRSEAPTMGRSIPTHTDASLPF